MRQPLTLTGLCGRYLVLVLVSVIVVPHSEALRELYDRFYLTLNDSLPCFRLTNVDSQIGCSGSNTNTRGVVHYVQNGADVEWLIHSSPHPPYIALMEPQAFSSYNVPRLRDSDRVNGILLRYDNNTSYPEDIEFFSAERKCPNKDFGIPGCSDTNPWNPYTNGTSLSFSDFGDFPIFAVPDHTFMAVLECFNGYNANSSGGIVDYPLCSAEMVADMLNAKNTETCFRRANLLTLLVNGLELCDPLGDKSVWGSVFELTSDRLEHGSIMLTTKLDSIAFFPYLSWGANNELAGVATLMAVLEILGSLKRSGELLGTQRPIVYSFFHGESWDYIGSSRMIYDMERGAFPDDFSPKMSLEAITDYLELTNLGLSDMDGERPIIYYHNQTASAVLDRLIALADINSSGVNISASTREDLPVASLQRFIRRKATFSGAVLSDFDSAFKNKFYGSRYDNEGNLASSGGSLDPVAEELADLASLIAQAVVEESGPIWLTNSSAANFTASAATISDVLYCFLVRTDCPLFQQVLTLSKAKELKPQPLQRYITVDTTTNSETIITHALLANLTGQRVDWEGQPSDLPMPCSNCSKLSDQFSKNDSQVTVVQMQYNGSADMCYCVKSYVHYHTAVSPAFHLKDYSSREYSTWVESRWRFINLRIYLVTYPLQEAALFFCGLAMIFITLLVAIQGSRKSDKIFNTLLVAHSPLHLTLADRRAPPEPIEASDSDSDSIPHDGTVRSRAPGGATNIQ